MNKLQEFELPIIIQDNQKKAAVFSITLQYPQGGPGGSLGPQHISLRGGGGGGQYRVFHIHHEQQALRRRSMVRCLRQH